MYAQIAATQTKMGLAVEETFTVTVKKVVFSNPTFSVFTTENGTVTAKLPVIEGQSLQVTGKWQTAKYGLQFAASTAIPVQPKTADGVVAYLQQFEGIGERTATAIIEKLGSDALAKIAADPSVLHGVSPRLSVAACSKIAAVIAKDDAMRNCYINLGALGLSQAVMTAIVADWGAFAPERLAVNPYILVEYIGFKEADILARSKLGMQDSSPMRIRAAFLHVLSMAASQKGHCYLPKSELTTAAAQLLAIPPLKLLAYLDAPDEEITVVDEKAYLTHFHKAELLVVEKLRAIVSTPATPPPPTPTPPPTVPVPIDEWDCLWEVDDTQPPPPTPTVPTVAPPPVLIRPERVSDTQWGFVTTALSSKVTILTGGPGTGKTTCLRALVNIWKEQRLALALCAPTGKAAKRMTASTDIDAQTIHAMLKWDKNNQSFHYGQDKPLPVDVVIVDESSMIDLMLFTSLLKAIPPTARLVIVGDIDQLPAVGAGNVLSDLIRSGIAPTTRLTEIFRQSEDSYIAVNAQRINAGQLPITTNANDFHWQLLDNSAAVQWLVDSYRNLRQQYQWDEIQILAPMYKGELGIDTLNIALQAAVNPASSGKAEFKFGDTTFRVGDTVLQTKNDVARGIVNGDQGVIVAITANHIIVDFGLDDEVFVKLGTDDEGLRNVDQLRLAYAVSVHKSQGSEYAHVFVCMSQSHYAMLSRGLLYTAVTRAKQHCTLVGGGMPVRKAVSTPTANQRNTTLAERLRA